MQPTFYFKGNIMLNSNLANLPSEGFVRLSVVLALIPVSKTQLWRMIKNGDFPQPKKLGPRIPVWDVNDIRDYIETVSIGGNTND